VKIYDISLTLSPRSIRWVTAQPLEFRRPFARQRQGAGNLWVV